MAEFEIVDLSTNPSPTLVVTVRETNERQARQGCDECGERAALLLRCYDGGDFVASACACLDGRHILTLTRRLREPADQ